MSSYGWGSLSPLLCSLVFYTESSSWGSASFASTGILRLPVLGCTEERVVGHREEKNFAMFARQN